MSVLLDKILDNENIYKAIDNVSRNKGTCGIDGMKVDELHQYMGVHLEEIKSKIKARSYYPLPVRRVEIPKPNGKKRKLGIPVVLDLEGVAKQLSLRYLNTLMMAITGLLILTWKSSLIMFHITSLCHMCTISSMMVTSNL